MRIPFTSLPLADWLTPPPHLSLSIRDLSAPQLLSGAVIARARWGQDSSRPTVKLQGCPQYNTVSALMHKVRERESGSPGHLVAGAPSGWAGGGGGVSFEYVI